MSLAVVHGSSSGLGLQFARYLLRNTSLNVLATSRQAESALRASITDEWGDRLMCLQMRGTEEESIRQASEKAKDRFGIDCLRLLINVPGVLHVEKSLAQITMENLQHSFAVNAFAHILACKYFVPLIPRKLNQANGEMDLAKGTIAPDSCLVANISARVGSISDNNTGGCSKAALNQLTVTLAREFAAHKLPAVAVALHPGTVKTQFSEQFVGHKKADGNGLFEPEDSAKRLIEVMSKLSHKDTGSMGCFLDWKGTTIEW